MVLYSGCDELELLGKYWCCFFIGILEENGLGRYWFYWSFWSDGGIGIVVWGIVEVVSDDENGKWNEWWWSGIDRRNNWSLFGNL